MPSAYNWLTTKAPTSVPKDRHVATVTHSTQRQKKTPATMKSLPIKFNGGRNRATAQEFPFANAQPVAPVHDMVRRH